MPENFPSEVISHVHIFSSERKRHLFHKISKCSEKDQIIFNLKGDWDAEKVIDIPNKKVPLKLQS